MKKKYVMFIIILLVLCVGGYFIYELSNSIEVSAGGAASGNKTITKTITSTPIKVIIDLQIDNSKCNNSLKYSIVNPKGFIISEGKVDAHKKLTLSTQKCKGAKGTWKIEFKKAEEASYFDFNYTFKTSVNLF